MSPVAVSQGNWWRYRVCGLNLDCAFPLLGLAARVQGAGLRADSVGPVDGFAPAGGGGAPVESGGVSGAQVPGTASTDHTAGHGSRAHDLSANGLPADSLSARGGAARQGVTETIAEARPSAESAVADRRLDSDDGQTVAAPLVSRDGDAGAQPGSADLFVTHDRVPHALDQADFRGVNWEIRGSTALVTVPGVGRMLIRDGREILVERETGATDADIAPFVAGTGVGVALHQRGRLALHASAVALDGRGIAICGPSGVGKSTLSAALCRAGCTFISDDVTAIDMTAGRPPRIVADGRAHRLWQDSLERLALDARRGDAVRPSIPKFHVDPAGEASDSFPLDAIIVLRPAVPPHRPGLERLSLADAGPLLRGDVYRGRLASRMGRDPALFVQIAQLLGAVRAFRLDRERDFDALDATVQAVLEGMRACR